jgi:hypothetical protein
MFSAVGLKGTQTIEAPRGGDLRELDGVGGVRHPFQFTSYGGDYSPSDRIVLPEEHAVVPSVLEVGAQRALDAGEVPHAPHAVEPFRGPPYVEGDSIVVAMQERAFRFVAMHAVAA